MQQPLVIDMKAMMDKSMADILETIRTTNEILARINMPRDLNRAEMRRYEAQVRPLRLKLARLKAKQLQMQKSAEEAMANVSQS